MLGNSKRNRTGWLAACWLAFLNVTLATADPGDPAGSLLPPAPGISGAVNIDGGGSIETVIPVGPGPSYPRVPRGITQPTEPFGWNQVWGWSQ